MISLGFLKIYCGAGNYPDDVDSIHNMGPSCAFSVNFVRWNPEGTQIENRRNSFLVFEP